MPEHHSSSIEVSCRVRPSDVRDQIASKYLHIRGDTVGIPNIQCHHGMMYFRFNNGIFNELSDNQHVFDKVCQPLCDKLLNKHTSTVLFIAYGMTGSGKTHTLLGSETEPVGMLQNMIRYFKSRSKCRDVKMSGVEIYGINDNKVDFYDLFDLSDRTQNESTWLRRMNNTAASLKVVDATDTAAKDAISRLHYASMSKNERSSRGHSIFILNVYTDSVSEPAQMLCIDLGGPEGVDVFSPRGDIDDKTFNLRKMEAGVINHGLLQLNQMLQEVSTPKGLHQAHGSGLRKFLYPFLAQTNESTPIIHIVFTLDPSEQNLESTKNTLRDSRTISNSKMISRRVQKDVTEASSIMIRERLSNLKERMEANAAESNEFQSEKMDIFKTRLMDNEDLQQMLQQKQIMVSRMETLLNEIEETMISITDQNQKIARCISEDNAQRLSHSEDTSLTGSQDLRTVDSDQRVSLSIVCEEPEGEVIQLDAQTDKFETDTMFVYDL